MNFSFRCVFFNKKKYIGLNFNNFNLQIPNIYQTIIKHLSLFFYENQLVAHLLIASIVKKLHLLHIILYKCMSSDRTHTLFLGISS